MFYASPTQLLFSYLLAALLEYFASPALRSYPVVEVLKAELRNHTNFIQGEQFLCFLACLLVSWFPIDRLLQSLLQRLVDTVVLEIILSAESAVYSLGGSAVAGEQAASASLALFKESLDESIRDLPINDEAITPDMNGASPDGGRKRPWKDVEER